MPNSNVSSMLVNHSRRDKYLFDRQLELSGDTSFTRLPEIIATLYNRFNDHTELEGVEVNVTSLSQAENIRLSLLGYVLTTNRTEYIKIQSELMLEAVTALDSLGIVGKISEKG